MALVQASSLWGWWKTNQVRSVNLSRKRNNTKFKEGASLLSWTQSLQVAKWALSKIVQLKYNWDNTLHGYWLLTAGGHHAMDYCMHVYQHGAMLLVASCYRNWLRLWRRRPLRFIVRLYLWLLRTVPADDYVGQADLSAASIIETQKENWG